MNRTAVTGIIKIVTLFTIISLLVLNIMPISRDVEGIQGNPNTEIFIKVHTWNSISVNYTENTNVITDFPIEDVRAQMDGKGNNDDIVDPIEVKNWSKGLETKLNQDFEQNQGKDTHTFQMLIGINDQHLNYGTFNRTRVYFENMEGPETSTSAAQFSIVIFLDYKKTSLASNSYLIKMNIGEFFPDSQGFFKTIKLEIPDKFGFNTTTMALPEEIAGLIYEDDTLLNATFKSFSEDPNLSEWIKVNGLSIEKVDTSSNGGNGNGNGQDENGDSDNDEFFLSNVQLMLIIVVIIIIVIAVIAVTSKKKED